MKQGVLFALLEVESTLLASMRPCPAAVVFTSTIMHGMGQLCVRVRQTSIYCTRRHRQTGRDAFIEYLKSRRMYCDT